MSGIGFSISPVSSALPSPLDLVGAILSRKYALDRLVGVGGMGAVYEARNLEDGQQVAVKVLSFEYLNDGIITKRFLDEGRICQHLIHPNIVRVFDVETAEDGTPYIVMELLDGVPLSEYTRAGVRVPPQQAATILHGILAGLAAAHAQGIVHRDLKPENVFLAREPGGAFAPKVLDFGIAKVMDAAGGMGGKTRTGVLLGTPAYMSPEQIKNAKDVDARTDLWSAGVMAYEMLAGRVAFPAPTEYARLAAVLNVTPPTLATIDPQLARLSPLIQTAMQKDRAQRFQSALEMARALSSAVGADVAAHSVNTASLPLRPSALSRLPEVPSVWLSGGDAVHSVPSRDASTAVLPPIRASAPPTDTANLVAAPSRPSHVHAPPSTPSPFDVRAPSAMAAAGTLPSENLPILSAPTKARRGIPGWAVVLLVLAAFAAGYAFGQSRTAPSPSADPRH